MKAPRPSIIPIRLDASHVDAPASAERRRFLGLMAASMALAGSGCSGPPAEPILPYVQMPENLLPGQPKFYATAFVHRARAEGVLVQSEMGRPIKVEGNPHHPASLGATSVLAQASILQLWDPDRSQTVRQGDALSTWQAFLAALAERRPQFEDQQGARLRILSPALSSPTLARQRHALLEKYPQARWHIYDPLLDSGAMAAARLAYGRALQTLYRFEQARLVLCLDADVFNDWPGSLRHARDFVSQGSMRRLVVLESTPSLTGAMADDRLALPPVEIEHSLWRLARALGMVDTLPAGPEPDGERVRLENAIAAQLQQWRGQAVVVAGPGLSAPSRALVYAINARLGNTGRTVRHLALLDVDVEANAQNDIAALTAQMHAGEVDTLLILGGNPVYDAPVDLDFAGALDKVECSIHLGLYRDETARRSLWHIPAAHAYESWSDARAWDGSASIVQPLIAPLYGGHGAHELLALLAEGRPGDAHALIRQTWQGQTSRTAFDALWQSSLRQGVIADTASAQLLLPAPTVPAAPELQAAAPLVARFVSDASTAAGEFANNAWLQELPRPLTRHTWDNAALMSAATARSLGVDNGDVVELSPLQRPQAPLRAPVWIQPNHADGVISLPLGYGRHAAGRVGNGVGFNAYRLFTQAAQQAQAPLPLAAKKTGARHAFALTQRQDDMQGREMVRLVPPQEASGEPQGKSRQPPSLYPEHRYDSYRWGMVIDLDACIGCGACTIACQAENNIPVVGKEEVARGRAMHWIRVDRYYQQDGAQGSRSSLARTLFQPVPCMHCEKAPCEEVCPVGATVHDSEGLNVQVYNRCVGTRFCSNNCPYKVRRFNFLQYANTQEESLKALQNPDVTVRRRGVMEKCSYCLQRITRARLEAEKLGRRVRDGEVVTACQAACPTAAIVFGDLSDASSRVARAKSSPRNYDLLAELNTRPRTSYLARVARAPLKGKE